MKKITLANPKADVIKFLARGQRNSPTAVELVIDAKGVVAQDQDAALAKERFGSNIIVEDIDAKAAAKEASAQLKPEVDAAEEARRAALTDEERAAEDEAKAKAEADAKSAAEAEKAAKKAAKAAAKSK